MTPGFDYEVRNGDCCSSVAERYGFFWRTIWNANPELKTLRKNPNVLLPGDLLKIPDKDEKIESCPTDNLHSFLKKGTPAKFRLVVERFNIPLANKRYLLTIDGTVFDGTTDSNGFLEVSINPAATGGKLQMPDDQLECQLEFGHLDPVDQVTGLQQRLQNLGFLTSEPTGEFDEDTASALAQFQSSVNLPANGELDEASEQKLFQMQDKEHPQRKEENAPPEPADPAVEDEQHPDAATDPHEDEAEMARFLSIDD